MIYWSLYPMRFYPILKSVKYFQNKKQREQIKKMVFPEEKNKYEQRCKNEKKNPFMNEKQQLIVTMVSGQSMSVGELSQMVKLCGNGILEWMYACKVYV